MKSPEYAAATVRLYRAVIDEGDALEEARYQRLVRNAQRTFAREPTTGWLASSSGSHLVDVRFPGHRGARLGAVVGVRREGRGPAWVRLTLGEDLSLRDGLAFMSLDGTEQRAFSVQGIRKAGRDVRFARSGESVEVRLPGDIRVPEPGQEVRQLSSRFLDLPEPKEGSVAAHRIPVEAEVRIDGSPGGDATVVIAARGRGNARVEERVSLEEGTRPRPFLDVLGPLLAESGDSLFVATAVTLANATSLADDRIFIPPSQLKRVKNRFYARLDDAFRASIADRAALIARVRSPRRARQAPSSALRSVPRSPTGPRSLRGDANPCPSRGSRRTARSMPYTSLRARDSPWSRCRRSWSTPGHGPQRSNAWLPGFPTRGLPSASPTSRTSPSRTNSSPSATSGSSRISTSTWRTAGPPLLPPIAFPGCCSPTAGSKTIRFRRMGIRRWRSR